MVLDILIGIFVFIFGLIIGSFLNCLIYRIEEEKEITGRSFCPNCKHQLSWQDLVPVFSFMALGGKCRYCKKKISWQYPVVELATGLMFLLIYNLKFEIYNQFEIFQFLNLAFLFYIIGALIIIFVYDLKHYIIPDKVVIPAIVIAFVYRLFESLVISNFKFQISNYLFAAFIASAFFYAIWFVSQGKWMGFGDVKLAILMGLLLGVKGVLVALFLSFFIGAIIGSLLIAGKKKGLKSEIPFGPFMVAGTFIAFLWGEKLVNWYFNFFRI